MPSPRRRILISTLILALISTVGLLVAQTNTVPGNPNPGGALRGRAPGGMSRSLARNSYAVSGPIITRATKHDTSPPLRDLPPITNGSRTHNEPERDLSTSTVVNKPGIDPVVQRQMGPNAMPTPIVNFAGQSNPTACGGCSPPDTNGEVGPNHYIQMVNVQFQIFDKQGASLFGPVDFNTLFQGFGGSCQNDNDGDPLVLYDQLADRWVLTQFALTSPNFECIAVSATSDPLGSYHRYAFQTNVFPDYPKLGVWPDAYYMTINTGGNAGAFALERDRMLLGQSARSVYFENTTDDWAGLLPSDLDGTTLPPAGSPNYIIGHRDDQFGVPSDVLKIFEFHVDWVTPANSTFTLASELAPATYDGIVCPGLTFSCIRQPGTAQRLDAISDWTMMRMAYRNFGTHESIVFNHTVDVTGLDEGNAGIRWYELRNLSGTPTIFQQGTYAPDSHARWMGSMAMDRDGNIAMGYNIGGTVMTPSLRYAGRLVTDPPGQLGQAEEVLINGGGVQTGSNRWGDYSDLTVDPTDDCTFWFTGEYYQATSANAWRTRIGSFKFPGCGAGGTVTPSPTTQPTSTATAQPSNTPAPTATQPPATAIATETQATPTTTGTSEPASPTPGSPTATPTLCTITFTDVPPDHTFYTFITCLACREIINGYTVGCESGDPCFRPGNLVTRGQFAKIVSNSAGFAEPSGDQKFEDVPPGHTFYDFIWRLAERGYVSGYVCGGVGEPCVPPNNLPYYRPNTNVTRGQLSKVVAEAAQLSDPVGTQVFEDVVEGSTFYDYIQRLANLGIMSGYACGGVGEPCVPPGNRPYFRPQANATRGQASKIVANTFFPECGKP